MEFQLGVYLNFLVSAKSISDWLFGWKSLIYLYNRSSNNINSFWVKKDRICSLKLILKPNSTFPQRFILKNDFEQLKDIIKR